MMRAPNCCLLFELLAMTERLRRGRPRSAVSPGPGTVDGVARADCTPRRRAVVGGGDRVERLVLGDGGRRRRSQTACEPRREQKHDARKKDDPRRGAAWPCGGKPSNMQ